MYYVILHRTIKGWRNVSSAEDESGVRSPLTFGTKDEAREELDELLQDMKEAGMSFSRSDYMIGMVKHPTHLWEGGE